MSEPQGHRHPQRKELVSGGGSERAKNVERLAGTCVSLSIPNECPEARKAKDPVCSSSNRLRFD